MKEYIDKEALYNELQKRENDMLKRVNSFDATTDRVPFMVCGAALNEITNIKSMVANFPAKEADDEADK